MDKLTQFTQDFTPVKKIHEHLCGFHFYSHDMTRQVEAQHYCSHLRDDVRQCVIYDSTEKDARLIGVEYIISAKLFDSLPDDEKKYWHSHVYEVKSGMLILPSAAPSVVVDPAEKVAMKEVINTYGKTWHFWQVDLGHPLPLGPPQLMMAFTRDGQLDTAKVAARDARIGESTEKKRKEREDIVPDMGIPSPAADHWQKSGKAWQVEMVEMDIRK